MFLSILLAIAAPQSAACEKLSADYDNAGKRMAFIFAQGIGDNSAARETMRETQQNGVREEARDTLALMTAHKCTPPTEPPSDRPYFMQAIKCGSDMEIAKMKGESIASLPTCEFNNWKRER